MNCNEIYTSDANYHITQFMLLYNPSLLLLKLKQIFVLIFIHERHCQNFHHPRYESNSSRYKILSRKTPYLVQFDENHFLLFAHVIWSWSHVCTKHDACITETDLRLNFQVGTASWLVMCYFYCNGYEVCTCHPLLSTPLKYIWWQSGM
jgi:hypothetical protein